MMEKFWCVYKHTNRETGKVYVGRCRWPNYKDRWANGNGYRNSPDFWSDIQKYGWDGFNHEILYTDLSLKEANRLEAETITVLMADNPEHGYNRCRGGSGFTCHHTEATRECIANSMREYRKTDEHRKHLSEAKAGEKHHMARKVYQLTKDGEFIKEWGYLSKASEAIGIAKANITACCRGKRPSAGGYKWTYVWG